MQKGIFGMGKFTFIDLFAGIGGFHRALSCAGGELVAFSEIATDAVRAYCENFNEPETKNLGDITKLKDLPEHDFLTAGVPCQSWSIEGKKLEVSAYNCYWLFEEEKNYRLIQYVR